MKGKELIKKVKKISRISLIVSLSVSLIFNIFLLFLLNDSYENKEFRKRWQADAIFLSILIDKEMTADTLVKIAKKNNPDVKIDRYNNRVPHWQSYKLDNPKTYPVAIKIEGDLSFYFDDDSKLGLLESWTSDTSPMYQREEIKVNKHVEKQ